MKQQLVLRVLADAMGWNDDEAEAEFDWLRLMSRLKYDTYQGYLAGVRFIESLVVWLEQFPDDAERKVAYGLVRQRMLFVSANEFRHLIEQVYPREVQPYLVERAAADLKTPPYLVWAHPKIEEWMKAARRRVLFMGLSDGARTDVLRRANVDRISNEQLVLAPAVDYDKWRDLKKELKRELPGDPKFDCVWVLDDLTASGTTLLRNEDGWHGKLWKLKEALSDARRALKADFPIAERFDLRVHHYLATKEAMEVGRARCEQAAKELKADWFQDVRLSCGLVLDDDVKLKLPDDLFVDLAQKYYDTSIENRHQGDVRMGYKGCALPLILEHNTPNNSMGLLWAETDGSKGHTMRPLFRRRTRHKS